MTTPQESATSRDPHRNTAYDEVAVAPRYLAGGTGVGAEDAFAPLDQRNWYTFGDDLANVYTFTHDDQLCVAFVPEPSTILTGVSALWQIRAHAGPRAPWLWTAGFTDETPPEVIAALTTALNADVTAYQAGGPCRHLHGSDPVDTVWNPLQNAGWDVHRDGTNITAAAPEGLAQLSFRPVERPGRPMDAAWRIAVRPNPDTITDPLWEAHLDLATPPHLIAALAHALVDPTPLTRERFMIPDGCSPYTTPL